MKTEKYLYCLQYEQSNCGQLTRTNKVKALCICIRLAFYSVNIFYVLVNIKRPLSIYVQKMSSVHCLSVSDTVVLTEKTF